MTASPHRPGDDRFSVGVRVGGAGELSLAWRGMVQRVGAVSLARGDRCSTTYYPLATLHYPLSTTHHPPPTTCYLLPTNYCDSLTVALDADNGLLLLALNGTLLAASASLGPGGTRRLPPTFAASAELARASVLLPAVLWGVELFPLAALRRAPAAPEVTLPTLTLTLTLTLITLTLTLTRRGPLLRRGKRKRSSPRRRLTP